MPVGYIIQNSNGHGCQGGSSVSLATMAVKLNLQ